MGAILGDGKQALFRLIQTLFQRVTGFKAQLGNFTPDVNQPPPHEFVHDQGGVLVNVGGAEGAIHQLSQAALASHFF